MKANTKLTALLYLESVLLISLLLTSHGIVAALAPTPHSTYHKGDSYTTVYFPSEIAPPNGTKPPTITITSPNNNSLTSLSNLTLAFNLILEGLHPFTLESVTCKPSWQSDNITLGIDQSRQFVNVTLPFSTTMNNIPDGEQSITIYANILCVFKTGSENVSKPVSGMSGIPPYGNYLYVYSNYYFDAGSSSIDFTVETSPTNTPKPDLDVGSVRNFLYAFSLTALVVIVIFLTALAYFKKREFKLELVQNS